tara:strand:+ start:62 stop:178 length:117 start_codon:yes stop_codon:yes gene_type:complete
MSDFDIAFLAFYVLVCVVIIPIAYMVDKRKETSDENVR